MLDQLAITTMCTPYVYDRVRSGSNVWYGFGLRGLGNHAVVKCAALALLYGCSAPSKGDSPTDDSASPTNPAFVHLAGEYSAVDTTYGQICAIRSDRTVACWAEEESYCIAPERPEVLKLATTFQTVCSLDVEGELVCESLGAAGKDLPAAPFEGAFEELDAEDGVVCALDASGQLRCTEPFCGIDNPSGFESFSVSSRFGCGVDALGALVCWGNYPGSSCVEEEEKGYCACETPAPLTDVGPYQAVAVGEGFFCTRRRTGEVACVDGATAGAGLEAAPPIAMDHLSADHFVCGLDEEGHARCWGRSDLGFLPRNPPDLAFTSVSPGRRVACGVTAEGELWCWGDDVARIVACEDAW